MVEEFSGCEEMEITLLVGSSMRTHGLKDVRLSLKELRMSTPSSPERPTSNERLQQLADISRLFTEMVLDLDTLLETIVEAVSRLLGDSCAIRILSDDGEVLLPAAIYHPNPATCAYLRDMLSATTHQANEGLSGQVVIRDSAVFLPHITLEQSRATIKPEYLPYIERYHVHSMILVPLRNRGRLMGTLGIGRDITPEPYQESDAVFLQDLADRAAMALDNAQLYAHVSAAKQHLEQRVAQRTSALSAANEQLKRELERREQLETMLEQLNRRHRLILDSLGEGLIVLDRAGHLTFANPAALGMLGWYMDDLLGQRKHEVLHHSRPDGSPFPRAECPMCAAIEDGTVYHSTAEFFWTKTGHAFPVEVMMTPLVDGAERLGAVIVFSDITQQRQIDRDLREAKAAAEQANKAKSEFLSRMSHELRTPLNAILGFTQVLQMDALSEDQQDSLHHILNGGRHLLNLINEVLDLARIESGNMTLSPEPILVRLAVLEAVDTMRVLAAERAITLSLDIDALDEHTIIADQQRLKQVLFNLLSNAIKYNRANGQIMVSGQLTANATLRIAISDTGCGIDPAYAANMFKPFERLGAQTSGIEGTGLGLALSKNLVHAMHGQLDYMSIPGAGTTFWLEFPLNTSSTAEEQRPASTDQVQIKPHTTTINVLLIEDNLSNLRLIERLLHPTLGFNITAAMQGQLGLDLALQHQPDIILLDLHLPDMHGEDVLKRLKLDSATTAIPVVVITADATVRQSDRLLGGGAHAYLAKPLDVPLFLTTINDILGL